MIKKLIIPVTLIASSLSPLTADEDNSAISVVSFNKVADEATKLREKRLISEKKFLKISKRPRVVILDSRSKYKFDKLHVKGAVHLNFSDFTEETLRKVIPDKNTTVLIYCNNNFKGEPTHFPMKLAGLALNIPTFLNLHGYGYTNVFELKPLLDIKTTKIPFAGTSVQKNPS